MTIDIIAVIAVAANIATIIGFGISIYALKTSVEKKINKVYATVNQNGTMINYHIIGNPTFNNSPDTDTAVFRNKGVRQ